MLVLQNQAQPALELAGVEARLEEVRSASAKFDLSLSLAEQHGADGSPAGIAGVVEYASELFEQESVERLAQRFIRLLEEAVADPDRALGSVEILTADERQTILRDWNDTARLVPCATVPELFAAQVERTPDAVAVIFEEEQLSYRELDERSSRLAHYLRGRGVGPEVVVGLCLERSLELIVGLLGILKAGGAYLPLDPDYPRERLSFMVADAGARLIVTQSARRSQLPQAGADLVCLHADWPSIAREPSTAPASRLLPHNLAYVIYTSGSTGTPKGVAVDHASLANKILTLTKYFDVGPDFRAAISISPTFDAA